MKSQRTCRLSTEKLICSKADDSVFDNRTLSSDENRFTARFKSYPSKLSVKSVIM